MCNKKIGATGFEPATSWSRTKRANRTALRPDFSIYWLGRVDSNHHYRIQNPVSCPLDDAPVGFLFLHSLFAAVKVRRLQSCNLFKHRTDLISCLLINRPQWGYRVSHIKSLNLKSCLDARSKTVLLENMVDFPQFFL